MMFLLVAGPSYWRFLASDFDYDALSGTYLFRDGGESVVLILRKDATFQETVTIDGTAREAHGAWYRSGQSSVTFSEEFRRLPGQQTYSEKFGPDRAGNFKADHEFGGRFERQFGIFRVLYLDGSPDEIELHTRFRF